MPKNRLTLIIAAAAALLACAAHGALPKFMGGSGFGVGGNKGNLEGKYPTYWDNLMQQQSYTNMYQGMREMSEYKYKAAAANFGKAVVKNPGEPYPHIFLGMALYWQGQVDGAMAEYRAALDIAPDNDDARQLLGIAYAWKGDINSALEEFTKAIEINPKRADAQMNIGSTYAALGRLDDTLYHFRNAVNLDKRHPLYQYQLGSVYERLGRDTLAEEAFKKAISLYPRYEEAMLALAVLYEKMGKNTPAEINYKKALKIKPGDSVSRLRLANLLAKQGRRDEAVEILSRGFLISPMSNEGLALSIYYHGGGAAQSMEAQKSKKQLENFKNRLKKVPSSKQITIEVEMSLTPRLQPQHIDAAPGGDFPSALATVIEQQDREASTTTFSRTFILAGANDEERSAQLDRIISDFENVLAHAGGEYDVSMSLRAGTPVNDTSVLGGASTAGARPTSAVGGGSKAGYNPYMVGNDMGLWTPNKNWINYIDEVMAEILQRLGNDPRDYMVAAFAHITLGKGGVAMENFSKAAELASNLPEAAASKLMQIIYLGKGTAHIVLGDDDAALLEYKRVLALNPANEIAKINIAVLED